MIRGSKLLTAIFYIALALVILGVAGFILKLTNGGTDKFKVFYLTDENDSIYGSTDTTKLPCDNETKFNVNYTFEKGKSYSVQVLPNVTDETDFEYKVEGENYKFSDIQNLNEAFNVKLYDNYFTLQMPEDMRQVMGVLYAEKAVELPDNIDLMKSPYFKLSVQSYNEKDEVNITLLRAKIPVEGIKISPEIIPVKFEVDYAKAE